MRSTPGSSTTSCRGRRPRRSAAALAALCLVSLTVAPAAARRVDFRPARLLAAGTNVHFVATADFDGDGTIDVAAANSGPAAPSVSVLFNRGDGRFRQPVDFAVVDTPAGIAAADLNADGRADLVVPSDTRLTVLLAAEGESVFERLDALVGVELSKPVLGDFDADGALDLAALAPSGVYILRGGGDGTFDLPTLVAELERPAALAAGDLDLDGRLDFVAADGASATVTLLYGTSALAFERSDRVGTGLTMTGLAIAPYPGFHFTQVAVAGGTGHVLMLTVGSDRAVTLSAPYDVGHTAFSVAMGDVDGNGTPDVVTADWNSAAVTVLYGRGPGRVPRAARYSTGKAPYSAVVADLNADGSLDVVAGVFGYPRSVSVLLSRSTERGVE
jgi:hypothetical protein